MAIRILADDVVAQIAAGEVVERPASAIKEMIENALDAGAAHVRVDIMGDGRRLMRVSDDGRGILSAEVELAFARHATSKLASLSDLMQIRTLGFRGEALSSIASVSQTTLTSRHQTETTGTSMRMEGGRVVQRKSVGAPIGTVITVEHLFYNTPARLKFLKSEATEKRLISQVVTRYAMAYPHVRFILEQDGRETFRSAGAGELADVLVNVVGLEDFRNMLAVDGETTLDGAEMPIRVAGYTSSPSFNRADRGHITLFVNGRYIQDTRLSYAVIQAYHTLLMTGRFPIAVLMIDLPPESVDVNVHPTKAEVRFQNADAVFSAIQRAVRRAVIDHAQTPLLRGGRYQMPEDEPSPEWNHGAHHQLDMSLALEGPGGYARQGGAVKLEMPASQDETELDESGDDVDAVVQQRPRTLPMLRVVGQIGASYIVAEGPVGLYLIDQHAAHERILYEQFMADFALQQPMAQQTLAAQTIQVSPVEAHLLEDNLDALRLIGFVLEPFGPNTFVVRSVPAILADNDPVEVVAGILEDLSAGNQPGQSTIEAKIVLRVCKQAAVKAGQILSHDEMQALVRWLERTQSPLTCPHGRPTMIHMSSDQLAREFGRMGS